jgi:hypothetical protein
MLFLSSVGSGLTVETDINERNTLVLLLYGKATFPEDASDHFAITL